MIDAPPNPLEALGALVANYLRSLGIQNVMLELCSDDAPVMFDLDEAMDSVNVLPVLIGAAEKIYRTAGPNVAWPVALVTHQRATMGVRAQWRPGAAIWSVVCPFVMKAVHEIFQPVEDEPDSVMLRHEILNDFKQALKLAA